MSNKKPRFVEFFDMIESPPFDNPERLPGIYFVPKPEKRQPTINPSKIDRNSPCPVCSQTGTLVKWKKCTLHNPAARR